MRCSHCFAEFPDYYTECPECGTPVPQQPTELFPAINVNTAEFERVQEQPQEAPKNRKRIVAIVAVVVVLLLIAGGVGGYLAHRNAQIQQAAAEAQAYEDAHSLHAVPLKLTAEGYSDELATRFPVRVEGTDLDNNAINELAFVDGSGNGLELRQGDYVLSFPAAPLSADGTVWDVPDKTLSFQITSSIGAGDAYEELLSKELTYRVVTPAAISDDLLATAREYAAQDTERQVALDDYVNAAKEKREAAKNAEQQTMRDAKHNEFQTHYTNIENQLAADRSKGLTDEEWTQVASDRINELHQLATDEYSYLMSIVDETTANALRQSQSAFESNLAASTSEDWRDYQISVCESRIEVLLQQI